MHSGQDDYSGINGHRLPRQGEAVADYVGDAVKDLRGLIVVREDDGVPLALQPEDGVDILGEERPFERRNHRLDALVERSGTGNDIGQEQGGGHGHLLYSV